MEEIKKRLEEKKGEITSEIIRDLLEDHRLRAQEMKRLYRAYKAEELEILKRQPFDSFQANNKLINAYRTNIVDQVVGYMFGEPVQYDLDEEDEDKQKWLRRFRITNKAEDMDSTTGKFMTVCGYGARLCYIDKDLQERSMNLYPWETIVVKDKSLDETQFALRYYEIYDKETGKHRIQVEWYDDRNIHWFIEGHDGRFIPDNDEQGNNIQPHLFKYVPVIKFPNNDEEKGDFEIVESMIDAYDRLVSDAQNILEDFRAAYLVFENGEPPTKEEVDQMKQARALAGPGKVYYLTKEIQDNFLENQKKTLQNNIYKFAQAVDMDDEAFHTAESGEARKWRLMALENKAITKERKFDAALRNQFKVLTSYERAPKIDYLNLKWEFRRNVPVDLQYLGEVGQKLKGIVSHKTVLKLMPFVDDPEAEIEEIQDEMPEVDLDDLGDEGE